MSSLCDNCATVWCIFQAGIERERCAFYKNKNDVIKRQDAIDAIMREPTDAHYPSWYADRIKALPPAEPKTGKWIYLHGSIGSYMTISCPFCGVTFNNVAEWEYNFCPNCGSFNGGDKDD